MSVATDASIDVDAWAQAIATHEGGDATCKLRLAGMHQALRALSDPDDADAAAVLESILRLRQRRDPQASARTERALLELTLWRRMLAADVGRSTHYDRLWRATERATTTASLRRLVRLLGEETEDGTHATLSH